MRRSLLFASLFFGLTACEKNKLAQKEEIAPDANAAYVKLGYFQQHSTVNNASVQWKIDGERISGLITGNTPYPGGGFNTGGNSFADYMSVAAGERQMMLSVPASNTNVDSVVRFNGNVNIKSGLRQTVMITDTGSSAIATVLVDDITPPATPGLFAKAKFFNGMPGQPVDFYLRTPIGVLNPAKNLPYRGVSDYFDFSAGAGADTLDVVAAGAAYTSAASPTLARYIWAAGNIIPARVYTMLATGYSSISQTATTDNRRPRASIVLNR